MARVLVVDDEPDICDLLTMMLEDDERCEAVHAVGELDVVVDRALQLRPDCIVLDLMFGHRTCVDILPSLRRACPAAHIVVFTSSRRAAMEAGVLDLGADVVVQKVSVSFEDLADLALSPAVRVPLPCPPASLRDC
jgi:DNA-binding NarL/FixJ family response regulator